MGGLFLKVLNMSFAAWGIILAVILLRAVLRKAPKAILCGLWALAALRLLVPVTIPSPTSLVPREEIIPVEALYQERADVPESSPAAPAEAPAEPQTAPPVPTDGPKPRRTWADYGAYVWLAGVGAMSLYALGSYLWLRRRVGPSLEESPGVWICDAIDTPFVLGVLHPRIYLPSSLEGEEKGHVLAHERAHLRRRDNWWKPLGFLTLAIHWFDPLCWLGYVLFCRDMELAADEKVIRDMEKLDRVAYSKTLLACSAPKSAAPCPLAFGEVGVKERIRSILRYKKPGILLVVLTVAAALVLTACFMTSRGEGASDAYAIEGRDWVFDFVQDKDGHVVYRSQHSTYPEGEELELTLQMKKGTLYLESGGEQWEIPYTPLGEGPEHMLYTLNGGDPASGKSDMAVISHTLYEDGRVDDILILAVEGWSIQFREKGDRAPENTEPVNGESFFNAKVVRVYDRGFLVEPCPGQERQAAMEILLSGEVLSTNPVPEVHEGDHLRIVYNGGILKTYPAQLDTVFAIYPLSEVEEKTEIDGSFPVSGYPTAVIEDFAGDEGKLKDARLTLLDSGQFTMSFDPRSDRFGAGTYTMEDNELSLDFSDGSVMTFTMDGGAFTLIGEIASCGGPSDPEAPTVVNTYGSEDTKVYEELSDGTWRCNGIVYRYRLVLTDRLPHAEKDSTFVVLSDREDISFRDAYMAAGFSSSLEDYFDPADAVIVSWK